MPARRPGGSPERELVGLSAKDDAPIKVTFGRRISTVGPIRSRTRDCLLPGFIDLQINGAIGIDVMAASAEDLLRIARHLAHEGTTAWLPTVITAPLDKIEECDEIVAEAIELQNELAQASLRGSSEPVGATILGMHLEGPFISPQRLGAHPPLTLLPEGDALDRVVRLETLKLITLAPELPGSLDAIRPLIARGVTVSIGHTDATYEQALAGLDAGATMFTHLFNAMPPFHHRAPGPIGAATERHRPVVTIIPDGDHVHPAAVRLSRNLRLAFISDRLASAGTDTPPLSLFGRPCRGAYRDGRVVRLPDGTLAGSSITMLDGEHIMFRELDSDIFALEKATSANAAEALRVRDRGRIAPRARADLILLDCDLNLKAVFIAGQEVT